MRIDIIYYVYRYINIILQSDLFYNKHLLSQKMGIQILNKFFSDLC